MKIPWYVFEDDYELMNHVFELLSCLLDTDAHTVDEHEHYREIGSSVDRI